MNRREREERRKIIRKSRAGKKRPLMKRKRRLCLGSERGKVTQLRDTRSSWYVSE
jgi:hypothetical protein